MLSILEISSVVFVLIYLFYAARLNPIAWIFGCVASVLSFFYFWNLNLMGSAFLQAFYFLQGVNGYLNWIYFENDRKVSYRYSGAFHWLSLISLIVLSVIAHFVLNALSVSFNAPTPNYFDISLAIGSIWATQLETKKDIVCWWYWIVCNLGYAGLYVYNSLNGEAMWIYAALMLFLAVFSYMAKARWMLEISGEQELDAHPDEHQT